MRKLSTHVLDTAQGKPAQGMRISLSRLSVEGVAERLGEWETNQDGRTDEPLLVGNLLEPGVYELLFAVGAYFRKEGLTANEPAFLDEVPVRFGVGHDDAGYHVPLLCTPWAFSTYRGS